MSDNFKLQRFDQDGIELVINTETGESFATERGYARMSGKSQSTVNSRIIRMDEGERNSLTKETEILTPGGLQGARILTEDLITQWLPKDNPDMATQLLKLGIRGFLHKLAGFEVTSTAVEQQLTPLEILLRQTQALVDMDNRLRKSDLVLQQQQEDLVRQQVEIEVAKQLAAQSNQLALTASSDATEAKEGLNQVRDQLAALQEFAVAQPPGLDQDLIDQINQAFQTLGGALSSAGVLGSPACYQEPWKKLGLTMRNSSLNYDLNARYSNAMRTYNQELQEWKDNGSIRGQKPTKPSRPSILARDNKVTEAFRGAQQVIKDYLSNLVNS